MRVGAQPAAVDLLAELEQPLLAQPALEEAARVDAGRAVALDVDQVAAMALGGRVPEMHEAGVVEQGRGLEAGDVPAQLRALLVGAQHDRQRVPADVAADPVLDRPVAGMRRLAVGRDGVEVGRVGRIGHRRPLAPRLVHQLVQQEMRPLRPLERQNRPQRVTPLAGLDGIAVRDSVHRHLPRRQWECPASRFIDDPLHWPGGPVTPMERRLIPQQRARGQPASTTFCAQQRS